MCELLGMSFNLPVRPKISFRKFRQRDEENPDGWGLAFYPDSSAQIFKEPLKATKSDLSGFLKDYPEVRSKIIIGHEKNGARLNQPQEHTTLQQGTQPQRIRIRTQRQEDKPRTTGTNQPGAGKVPTNRRNRFRTRLLPPPKMHRRKKHKTVERK